MKESHWDAEESFHSQDKKQFRKERKLLSKTDRSKYKKTDQDKAKAASKAQEGEVKGRVLSILPDKIWVDVAGELYACTLRGALKKEKTKSKNLIAVGDWVQLIPAEEGAGSITHVEERHSFLSRAETLHHNKQQLIAVNIDQVLITTAIVAPLLNPALIDRYIIAAYKGKMEPVLVINKIDLLDTDPEQKALYEQVVEIYRLLHIRVYPVSTVTGAGIPELKAAMQGKASVFSGQSGTGKTSLINTILGSDFRTQSVVERTHKGSHTTTTAQLLPIEGEGFCIDTPGIKSFGMWDLEPEEVRTYFSEIASLGKQCKYPNCSHLHEPDCAVQAGVESGAISLLRFESYSALMKSLKDHKPR